MSSPYAAVIRLPAGLVVASAILATAVLPVAAAPAVPYWLRGEPPRPHSPGQQPHPAVARIIVPEQNGQSYGSGTLVAVQQQFGLVVTNWHVVRDASGPPEFVFPGGFRSLGRALKVDRHWDLAAILIWRPPIEPVALAAMPPRPGDVLTIAGYGRGSYRAAAGRCRQYVAPAKNFPFEMVEVGVQARQGDSGGPILNDRGEVAGVLFGASEGTTMGSYVGRVRGFLASLAPALARPHAMLAANTPARVSPDSYAARGDTSAKVSFSGEERANRRRPGLGVTGLRAGGSQAVATTMMLVPQGGQEHQQQSGPRDGGDLQAADDVAPRKASRESWVTDRPRPGAGGHRTTEPSGSARRSPTVSIGSPSEKPGQPIPAQLSSSPPRRDAANSKTSGHPEALARGELPITWHELAGESLAEQLKTVLAICGALSICLIAIRLLEGTRHAD